MNIRSTILAAAAIVAGLCNVGIGAAPAFAQPLDNIEVAYQDLNLTHVAGRDRLDRRIAAAAERICGSYLITELKFDQLSRACQADVVASVQARRDALVSGERYASLEPTLRVTRAVN